MVKVYIKERINDQTTICSGGVTGNTTYLGAKTTFWFEIPLCEAEPENTDGIPNLRWHHMMASKIYESQIFDFTYHTLAMYI